MNALPRPLHLAPGSGGHGRLTLEYPALCYRQLERAPVHIPLRRISRIHFSPRVEIETPVLTACAQRGILLILHDEEGNPLARILGRGGQAGRLVQRLADLVERPHWESAYQDWLTANERRITGYLCHKLRAPRILASHPRLLRQWIAQQARQAAGGRDALQSRRLYGQIILASMQRHLAALGVDARNEQFAPGPPDLGRDLSRLAAFQAEATRLRWLQRRHARYRRRGRIPPPLERKSLVASIESQAPTLERIERDLTNRLHRWLIETA